MLVFRRYGRLHVLPADCDAARNPHLLGCRQQFIQDRHDLFFNRISLEERDRAPTDQCTHRRQGLHLKCASDARSFLHLDLHQLEGAAPFADDPSSMDRTDDDSKERDDHSAISTGTVRDVAMMSSN